MFLETSRSSSVHVEQVYDVPRSNSEALYFNQNFEDDLQTYDTPKTGKSEILELDYFQSDYDVPKVRKLFNPNVLIFKHLDQTFENCSRCCVMCMQ